MGHQAVLGFMDLDVETGRDGGDILLADTKTAKMSKGELLGTPVLVWQRTDSTMDISEK